ncbi:hypothetical protein [Amycolatopsis nalaikhensis]|uniref:Uncharacterized protein n=1 Tax=Amycolatopsis nalaikhensis TaxID=715472 RepID=A0ABY8XU84_9PSEU|nr:hypothetical protein [Amycolatopsis sp. 2-2]WIV59250.1 hypothetical protein QP939_11785 [Amycolatopsis sp. 2-2]
MCVEQGGLAGQTTAQLLQFVTGLTGRSRIGVVVHHRSPRCALAGFGLAEKPEEAGPTLASRRGR